MRRTRLAMSDALKARLRNNAARFWQRVDKGDADRPEQCWFWLASLNTGQYGQLGMSVGGKRLSLLAHRVAYFLTKGDIPADYEVRHTCGVWVCVNPDHLYLRKVRRDAIRERIKIAG